MSDLASTSSTEVASAAAVVKPRTTRLFLKVEDVFHEEVFFLILSVFIGIFSGLAVVCFRLAIDWTHLALLGPLPQTHRSKSTRLNSSHQIISYAVFCLKKKKKIHKIGDITNK